MRLGPWNQEQRRVTNFKNASPPPADKVKTAGVQETVTPTPPPAKRRFTPAAYRSALINHEEIKRRIASRQSTTPPEPPKED